MFVGMDEQADCPYARLCEDLFITTCWSLVRLKSTSAIFSMSLLNFCELTEPSELAEWEANFFSSLDFRLDRADDDRDGCFRAFFFSLSDMLTMDDVDFFFITLSASL
ncbi:hypothetical protein BpHYR1_001083 [Brachionus plicatilis]|uniref:Uncharacterized protein n=1 Tax=Brachionus plicatilis TaxID=10195 RepID=A0A3M7S5V4_BRAPC|nr:hypothetical protein BpHYR1_001083 [Brachionus plicatilis]